jgi:hypothetical protein
MMVASMLDYQIVVAAVSNAASIGCRLSRFNFSAA